MSLTKLQRYARAKKDPAMALVLEMDRVKAEIMAEVSQDLLASIRGRDGITPIKGKDYFTPNEISQVIEFIRKSLTLPKVLKGQDGRHGKDGKDAPLPVAGVDYPTEDQLRGIIYTEIGSIFALKPKDDGKISRDEVNRLIGKLQQKIDWKANAAEIARALESLRGKEQLDYSALKNTPPSDSERRRVIHRGGGESVQYYDLSALTNGVTKTFTIPANKRVVWVGGTDAPGGQYRQGTDYTGSGTTSLTLTSEVAAPTQGSTLHLMYVPS